MTRHKPQRPKLNSIYLWHRYLGVAVALFALLLAVTGLMLNHTDTLDLSKQKLGQRWLLQWYGIEPANGTFFRADPYWLSQWDEQLYLDSQPLPIQMEEPLTGAVALPTMIVAASRNHLLLFTSEGELIEQLGKLDGIPENIEAITSDDHGRLLLKSGNVVLAGSVDENLWQRVSITPIWPIPTTPPTTLRNELLEQGAGATLALERVILDLHSGRIFGRWGNYLMDGVALILLFNAISGLLIWWRRRQQRRLHARST